MVNRRGRGPGWCAQGEGRMAFSGRVKQGMWELLGDGGWFCPSGVVCVCVWQCQGEQGAEGMRAPAVGGCRKVCLAFFQC
jgi:hypothetical protein